MEARYRDRRAAGRALVDRLLAYRGRPGVVVLGLPRGGVPVAFEIARGLDAPLDIVLVRKLGVPGHEELAMGALASGGVRILNPSVVDAFGIDETALDAAAAREARELTRREREYRAGRPPLLLSGRTVILVDDGLATGSTMRAAIAAVRAQGPARVVVAVPVGARQVCDEFAREVDEVVCGLMPSQFYAVGLWYDRFDQTSDEEVRALLADAGVADRAAGQADRGAGSR